MNCKNCSKDISKHKRDDVLKCLEELGHETKNINAYDFASSLGVSYIVRPRHNTLTFLGADIITHDLELDILRICLVGDASQEEPAKRRRKVHEEEPTPSVEPEVEPVVSEEESEEDEGKKKLFNW